MLDLIREKQLERDIKSGENRAEEKYQNEITTGMLDISINNGNKFKLKNTQPNSSQQKRKKSNGTSLL